MFTRSLYGADDRWTRERLDIKRPRRRSPSGFAHKGPWLSVCGIDEERTMKHIAGASKPSTVMDSGPGANQGERGQRPSPTASSSIGIDRTSLDQGVQVRPWPSRPMECGNAVYRSLLAMASICLHTASTKVGRINRRRDAKAANRRRRRL